jgi:hypothetical protein
MVSTTSPGDAKPPSPGVKDAQASRRRRADLAFAACAHSRSRADQTSMGASCALGLTTTPTLLGPLRKKSWGDVPPTHPGGHHFSLKGPPHRGASTHPLSSRLPAKGRAGGGGHGRKGWSDPHLATHPGRGCGGPRVVNPYRVCLDSPTFVVGEVTPAPVSHHTWSVNACRWCRLEAGWTNPACSIGRVSGQPSSGRKGCLDRGTQ